MLRTIVQSAVRPGIIVAARRVLATDGLRADEVTIAEVRRAANAPRAESSSPARSAWSFRYSLNFYQSRTVSPRWFGKFTIPSALIRSWIWRIFSCPTRAATW